MSIKGGMTIDLLGGEHDVTAPSVEEEPWDTTHDISCTKSPVQAGETSQQMLCELSISTLELGWNFGGRHETLETHQQGGAGCLV